MFSVIRTFWKHCIYIFSRSFWQRSSSSHVQMDFLQLREHIIHCSSILPPPPRLIDGMISITSMPVHMKPHYYFLCAFSLAKSSQEVRGDAGRLVCVQTVPTRGWQDGAKQPHIAAQTWGSAEFPSFRKVTCKSSDQQPANFMHFTAPPLRRHMASLMRKRPTSPQFLTSQWRPNANVYLIYLLFRFFQFNLFCTQD